MMTDQRPRRPILPPGIASRGRAIVTGQYALMPAEGILASALPGFRQTTVRILTAPPMGARFAELLLEIAPGGGTTKAKLGPPTPVCEHGQLLFSGYSQNR